MPVDDYDYDDYENDSRQQARASALVDQWLHADRFWEQAPLGGGLFRKDERAADKQALIASLHTYLSLPDSKTPAASDAEKPEPEPAVADCAAMTFALYCMYGPEAYLDVAEGLPWKDDATRAAVRAKGEEGAQVFVGTLKDGTWDVTHGFDSNAVQTRIEGWASVDGAKAAHGGGKASVLGRFFSRKTDVANAEKTVDQAGEQPADGKKGWMSRLLLNPKKKSAADASTEHTPPEEEEEAQPSAFASFVSKVSDRVSKASKSVSDRLSDVSSRASSFVSSRWEQISSSDVELFRKACQQAAGDEIQAHRGDAFGFPLNVALGHYMIMHLWTHRLLVGSGSGSGSGSGAGAGAGAGAQTATGTGSSAADESAASWYYTMMEPVHRSVAASTGIKVYGNYDPGVAATGTGSEVPAPVETGQSGETAGSAATQPGAEATATAGAEDAATAGTATAGGGPNAGLAQGAEQLGASPAAASPGLNEAAEKQPGQALKRLVYKRNNVVGTEVTRSCEILQTRWHATVGALLSQNRNRSQ